MTTPDVVEKALARARTTGERVGEALVALGAVKDDDVLRAPAQQQNLAYLTRDELPSPLPIVKNLSPKYLRQYVVCPVSVEAGNVLTVATADPLNPVIVDDLTQSTGLAEGRRQPAEAIVEAIDRTYDGVATPLQRIVEGMDDDRGPTATRTSTSCATWRSRRRWSGSSTSSSRAPSTPRPRTSTSSRSRTRCASVPHRRHPLRSGGAAATAAGGRDLARG